MAYTQTGRCMISIAYDVTSLAQNRYGGVSEVCRQTLRQAVCHSQISPHAIYRRGDPANIDISGIQPRKVGWLDRIRPARPDIVHALGHRLPPTRGRKTIYTLHDAWSLYRNTYQSPRFQEKIGPRMTKELLRADAIISVSRATHEKLLSLDLVDPSRCSVVLNGVASPPARLAPVENPMVDQLPDLSFVLFVGRIEVRKNLEHVVDAVLPHSALSLVIVGDRGFGGEEIERDVLSSMPACRLHHFRQLAPGDLDRLYRKALTLLQPSWEEGFGLPIAEAMARSCPVICSNGSGGAEVAAKAGVLVDPCQPQESAVAIEKLQEDPRKRHELVVLGRERAAELTWEASFDRMVGVYTRLLQE